MRIRNIVFVALFIGVSLSGCSESAQLLEAIRKIDLLEIEKQEILKQFAKVNQEILEQLAKANNDIVRLQEENQKLNTELTAAWQKERDNLNRLFR